MNVYILPAPWRMDITYKVETCFNLCTVGGIVVKVAGGGSPRGERRKL